MKKASMIAVAAIMLSAMVAAAQNPPMPKPGPEVDKLKYFLGNWKEEGEMKPGPMGPGGKFTGASRNELMSGGFFIELHALGNMSMGKYTSTAFLGYNAEDKVYTYNEFSSTGEAVSAKGTVEGDTWTWTSEEKMGGKVMKGRFTEKITSPTTYDFKFEASMEGGEYATVMEGKATKTGGAGSKPAAKPAGAGATKTPTAKSSAADNATKTSASADGAGKTPKSK
ncbi:MAG TPA: DUF1579 family protein [Candidatus Angelobacter sp.]|nr:DUF1579 family protein [Candidatus Angelobacter sp.]